MSFNGGKVHYPNSVPTHPLCNQGNDFVCIFPQLSLSSIYTYMRVFYYVCYKKLNCFELAFRFCYRRTYLWLRQAEVYFSFAWRSWGGWSETGEVVLCSEVILESCLFPSCSSTSLGSCVNHISQGVLYHVCILVNRKGKGRWQGGHSLPLKNRFSNVHRSLLIISPWP